jgi:hypothetical protein
MGIRMRAALAVVAALLVAGCSVYTPAAPEEIARARHVEGEPYSVTLISMVSTRSGRSAHSALLINGSQQVLYDPAGTFTHPDLPRRGDIHYGVTPRYLDYYERYHARFSHYVQSQTIYVSRAAADQVLANAEARGPTPKMLCNTSIAAVLKPVPPFDGVRMSIFPEAAREDFARIPGVEDSFVYDDDIGQNNAWEAAAAVPVN